VYVQCTLRISHMQLVRSAVMYYSAMQTITLDNVTKQKCSLSANGVIFVEWSNLGPEINVCVLLALVYVYRERHYTDVSKTMAIQSVLWKHRYSEQ